MLRASAGIYIDRGPRGDRDPRTADGTIVAGNSAGAATPRTQCTNNLKQIAAFAFHNHEAGYGFLPTGGWGWNWIGSPDLGYNQRQPGGWVYNVSRFLDSMAIRNLGGTPVNLQRLGTGIATFNCRCGLKHRQGLSVHAGPVH